MFNFHFNPPFPPRGNPDPAQHKSDLRIKDCDQKPRIKLQYHKIISFAWHGMAWHGNHDWHHEVGKAFLFFEIFRSYFIIIVSIRRKYGTSTSCKDTSQLYGTVYTVVVQTVQYVCTKLVHPRNIPMRFLNFLFYPAWL